MAVDLPPAAARGTVMGRAWARKGDELMKRVKSGPNRWKGWVLGVLGSMAGLLAMDLYWKYVAPLIARSDELDVESGEGEEARNQGGERPAEPLEDISLFGR